VLLISVVGALGGWVL